MSRHRNFRAINYDEGKSFVNKLNENSKRL